MMESILFLSSHTSWLSKLVSTGVDISTDAPLLDTIETIGSIIDEICELTEELGC